MDQLSIPAARPGETGKTVIVIWAFGPSAAPLGADPVNASAKE
jgi:hypothetical protein